MTTAVIRKSFERPDPFPLLDLIWTPTFTERATVLEKVEGVSVPFTGAFGGGGATYYCLPAYFIFVMTERGDMRMDISKKVYDLLQVGDPIVVSYRQGRWTKGALKGKIAR